MTRARNIANRALSDITSPNTDQDITIDPNGVGDILLVLGTDDDAGAVIIQKEEAVSGGFFQGARLELFNNQATPNNNGLAYIEATAYNAVNEKGKYGGYITFRPIQVADGNESSVVSHSGYCQGTPTTLMEIQGHKGALGRVHFGRATTHNGNILESCRPPANKSGAVDIDVEVGGNWQAWTLTGNVTSISFSRLSGSDYYAMSVTLEIIQGGSGGYTVTWPSSVKWSGGVAPTLSTGVGEVDFIQLMSRDQGVTWYGFLAGNNLL
jgi:hypothetical protein